MAIQELRDPHAARQFIVHGLWMQRVVPTAADTRPALEWALEIAAAGQPLPPIGFVSDVGHVLLDSERSGLGRRGAPGQTGWPDGLARTYEDLVLGQLFADRSIERAGDAVRRYQGRDRARGVGFAINQVRERAGFGGVLLSPAIIKSLLEAPTAEILTGGLDAIGHAGLPLLGELYVEIVSAIRAMAEVLGPEDVFELEHGTALAELGQRVALRQVLQTAARLETGLPKHPPRLQSSPREVPTRMLDEDAYPVGGFASISTRGTIESLLHSQLAFMEPVTAPRPDLFDIKFIRDELLYYSRDENQFLRRRRSFVIAFLPDLVRARFKDVDLPTQRIVLTLALLVVAVRKLTDWLSADALTFEFLFIAEGEAQPLAAEEALLRMVFRESIANGMVRLLQVANVAAADEVVKDRARQSVCRALIVGAGEATPPIENATVMQLIVSGPRPKLITPDVDRPSGAADAWTAWREGLELLVKSWV